MNTRIRDVTDPASAILIFSALLSLEQLHWQPWSRVLVNKQLGHLHHFFEVAHMGSVNAGQFDTYWQMGHAIFLLCLKPKVELGYCHPVFKIPPPQARLSATFQEFWEHRMFRNKSHYDLVVELHRFWDINCDGKCGFKKPPPAV